MSETHSHTAEQRMTMVSTCLPPGLHERLQRAARDERRSISGLIRNLIEDHLDEPVCVGEGTACE
jgi:hypothetical protein